MEVKSGMSLDKFRKMVWPRMFHELSFYNIDIPYGNFNQPIIIEAEEF